MCRIWKVLIEEVMLDSVWLFELIRDHVSDDISVICACSCDTKGHDILCSIDRERMMFRQAIGTRKAMLYTLIHYKLFPLHLLKDYEFYLWVHDAYKKCLFDQLSAVITVKDLVSMILEF